MSPPGTRTAEIGSGAAVAVVIMAGGEASRMGGGKPLRLLGGRTLLNRAIERAQGWSTGCSLRCGQRSRSGRGLRY